MPLADPCTAANSIHSPAIISGKPAVLAPTILLVTVDRPGPAWSRECSREVLLSRGRIIHKRLVASGSRPSWCDIPRHRELKRSLGFGAPAAFRRPPRRSTLRQTRRQESLGLAVGPDRLVWCRPLHRAGP